MTDEVLKKKIVEVVLNSEITGIQIRAITGGYSMANNIADALIAAGVKFDPIPEREYQGQLAVVYRALFNMTNKYCDAERKIATTKDGWFSCGAVQLALLAREAISDAEKELAEEKKDDERPKKND